MGDEETAVSRPLLLDLFCCEGGAAMGYHRAGFEVIGVDLEPQPLYPFRFIQADALDVLKPGGPMPLVAAIHASPPCQSYSTMANRHGSDELELIAPTRELLEATGLPWVIENVGGARSHMRSPMSMHGGQFGLNLFRPRLFESNVLLTPPPKAPRPKDAAAVYGRREDRRLLWVRADGTELRAASLDEARDAMGMPWASWNGCREAIPPAYTEYIGRQLLAHVGATSAGGWQPRQSPALTDNKGTQ
jgi:DNA (cytosine-5)-methyltransferase 1